MFLTSFSSSPVVFLMPVLFFIPIVYFTFLSVLILVIVPVELFSKLRHILGEERRNTLDVPFPTLVAKVFDLVEYE
jgi:hypothetical protein